MLFNGYPVTSWLRVRALFLSLAFGCKLLGDQPGMDQLLWITIYEDGWQHKTRRLDLKSRIRKDAVEGTLHCCAAVL